MKKSLNEEFRRMQKLAGLINESELNKYVSKYIDWYQKVKTTAVKNNCRILDIEFKQLHDTAATSKTFFRPRWSLVVPANPAPSTQPRRVQLAAQPVSTALN